MKRIAKGVLEITKIARYAFNVFILAVVCTMLDVPGFGVPDVAFVVCIIGSIFIGLDIFYNEGVRICKRKASLTGK